MRPEIAVIMLHPGCAIRCVFCVTEPFPDLGFEQATTLLEGLRARGIRKVVLGGGEPFDWRHSVVALAGRAKDLGLHVQVGTNGIHLPEGFERLDAIDRYVLPLESMDPGVHDRLRISSRSHHAIILDRLGRLREARKSVTVSTVVTRQNIGGLEEIGRFLKAYHCGGAPLHAWHLYRFLPLGRGGAPNADQLSIDEAEYHQACDALKAQELGFAIYKCPDMYRSRSVAFFQPTGSPTRLEGIVKNSRDFAEITPIGIGGSRA